MIRLFCLILISTITGFAQDKPAYKLFRKDGKAVDYETMIQSISKAEVILFGEIHNNAVGHWLELQVLKDVFAIKKDMAIGMEMFEADDQIVLSEYLKGVVEERHLLSEAKMWDNYATDYRPLVEFAREKQLPVIATNVPRRYANLVFRKGLDALNDLPEQPRKWIAPLPIEIDLDVPGYRELVSQSAHGHDDSGSSIAKSQAVKDATMAHFIATNRKGIFLHFNGAYHSKSYGGICWYLKKINPSTRINTIHTVEQEFIDELEDSHRNLADFIICIPKDMTKTY